MKKIIFLYIITGILIFWSAMASAQSEMSTVISFEVEHKKGCVNLVYPASQTDRLSDVDVHTIPGNALVGHVNNVAEIIEGRYGEKFSLKTLLAAGYNKARSEDGKKLLVKEFTVDRQAISRLCIMPKLENFVMVLEARAKKPRLKTETHPNYVLKYAAPVTTSRVQEKNRKFMEQASREIQLLIEDINQRRIVLGDTDLLNMLRKTGVAKTVRFSFGGQAHTTTVKLRRVKTIDGRLGDN